MNQFSALGVSTAFFEVMRMIPEIEAAWARRSSSSSAGPAATEAEWDESAAAGDTPATGSRFTQYEAKYWAWLRSRHDTSFASFREFARCRAGVCFLQKLGLLERGPRQGSRGAPR